MILTWADAHFCAAHRSDDGRLHGHTWRVRAYWPADGTDVLLRQAMLRELLTGFDHAELEHELRRAEAIAEAVGMRLGCAQVDVWREPEGLGASWTA